MLVECSNAAKKVRNVVASMAIEDMYFTKDFISDALKVSEGKKTSEEFRQEIIKKYAR